MKLKSYHILYRFFSYLSDRTNGASFFVKYKLLIGTLLIGLTTASCNRKAQVSCYEVADSLDDTIQVDDKQPADTLKPKADTTKQTRKKKHVPPPVVKCYEIVAPAIDIPEIKERIMCYITISLPEEDEED